MNEATLPPSPNWYLGSILACARDGTIAWGARNAIVIASPQKGKNIFKYSIISDAHVDRVTSLAFSPKFGEDNQNLLVSGGDEYVVRIWNLETMSAVMAHSYADTQQKVIAVDWSRANSETVSCLGIDGVLIVWNVDRNITQQISLGKLTATCLSSCPHNSDLVAIGTKSGLVYVVDIRGAGKIIYKLRGHDAEISCLSWCPIPTNIVTGTDSKDLLLASGAKDRSIFIWKAGGDGRYQVELTLPSTPLDSHQHRSKLGIGSGGWTAVRWVTPKLLLTSSSWGELISWDLSTSVKSKPSCKLIHACHSRGLFCIADAQDGTEDVDVDWRAKDTKRATVWTLAQDRRIIRCEIKSGASEITYNVPTQGGYTYCISASPLDTSRVAFGVGDAMLRLWNLCEPHENTFDITMLWQKIKGKVMAISWHPEKENLLAFGTGEGRVGMFDTNTSKPPVLYRQYHRHAVYTLGWGPKPNGETGFVLYSCGDGELVYYDPEKPNQEPKSVVKKDCTEFSWKPDGSCLAIGFENGLISFLNRNLEKFGTDIYSLKKPVQCLQWHPESTSTDLELSPLRNLLAVSTNAPTIVIFDLTESAKSSSPKDSTSQELTSAAVEGASFQKLVATLNGHTAKIVALAWSPHISGYLASAAYDNTVQVWKTESQELIGTYTGHCGPVQCCMWSPLNPDLIISGSADFTVRIWKLSEQEVRLPTENLVKPKKVRTKKKKAKAERIAADGANDTEEFANGSENNVGNSENVEYATTERESREALAADQSKRKRNKKTTYFPVMAKSTNDKESILTSVMNLVKDSGPTSTEKKASDPPAANGNRAEESNCLSLFGNREDVLSLLDTEKSAHAKMFQHDTVTEMDLWCNNLKRNLQEAVKEKRLNDFLVSMTPRLSFKVWQETCESYAAQLEFEGNRRKAVSYLLCIHKIERAVQVFIDGKMFKEAYALAKCRLDATDPLINAVLESWAVSTIKEGNYEEAVQCYVKLGNYKEAAKFLGRRKDTRSLEVAAWLALRSDDEEFSATLAERAINEALLKSDYNSAEDFIHTFPGIQHCELKLAAIKTVDKIFGSFENEKVWTWLEGNAKDCLIEKLSSQYQNCKNYYTKLLRCLEAPQVPTDDAALRLEVASQIALAMASLDEEKKLSHLVAALDILYKYEITIGVRDSALNNDKKLRNLIIAILPELDSKCPSSDDGAFVGEEPPVRKSLRAYLCYGITNWLLESDVNQLEKDGRRELVASLMKITIGDALDKRTVRYNIISTEISKLEGSLAIALGKAQKIGDVKSENQDNVESLTERLAEIRNEKEIFLKERISAPNPIFVYSKARELASVIFQGEIGERMEQILSEIWTEATT